MKAKKSKAWKGAKKLGSSKTLRNTRLGRAKTMNAVDLGRAKAFPTETI
jgi:hypothetical protein